VDHFFGDSILKFAEFWVFRTYIGFASCECSYLFISYHIISQTFAMTPINQSSSAPHDFAHVQSVLFILEMGQGRSRRFVQAQCTSQ